ncbi:uridine kinase [Fonticula alba]|uniref:Uridine kinase n=1 Tax=Fonticula alba TaxID=691883 RepID=A0A058Z8W4_FONAL|nr:uridine kinase [Fonticula alba]KCV70368.1 uridine kinase [Fonticula alba]|eukprot:XP_009494884.1 uridine kinase [Fonticula alba]
MSSSASRSNSSSPPTSPKNGNGRHKAVFAAGRPPWYTRDGAVKDAFMISCAGGSASGKTTVAQAIISRLNVPWVAVISMDSFYRNLTPEQIAAANRNDHDFDCPEAFDIDLVYESLKKIKKGQPVDIPVYDFTTHSRRPEKQVIYGANVVVFEGIFGLYDERINELMDLRIFVDTDDDVRLARRLKRDISERGRDINGVIEQYNRFVKPSYDNYIRPAIKNAHVIIPRGGDNYIAIDLIAKHIQHQLETRGFNFRQELGRISPCSKLPDTIKVMESRPQLRAMHTLIRNRDTPRDDFVFYSERLFRLLIEEALSHLPFTPCDIVTPTGGTYHGVHSVSNISAVSIVRAGTTIEPAAQAVLKDVKIGKILIQSDIYTNEPQLHFCSLPRSIASSQVLLMDATIATGAAALMAIRVLLDHNVPEENIIFVSLIAAPHGLHTIAAAHPKVTVVVSEVDETLNEAYHIIPGVGNFGDRFFGTD